MDDNLLRLGDLVLSNTPGPFRRLEQWLMGCEWTHVDVYIGEGLVLGAVWPEVRIMKLQDIANYTVYRVEALTDEEAEDFVNFVRTKLGSRYDFLQFFVLAFRLLTGSMEKYHDDPDPEHYVCSELVAEGLARYGISFGKYVDNILPRHLMVSPLTRKII